MVSFVIGFFPVELVGGCVALMTEVLEEVIDVSVSSMTQSTRK
ncbi:MULTISPECIES: hypothetical protein [Candidatus Ichthyocystis]|nr:MULTISPECIES: hypothetical protein [Ichthyocystis]